MVFPIIVFFHYYHVSAAGNAFVRVRLSACVCPVWALIFVYKNRDC